MKKTIHLLLGILAFALVSISTQAADASSADITAALDKIQKAGIINAEDHAYFSQQAFSGKTVDVAKTKALLAATAKYYGDPAETAEQIVDSMLKKKIVINKGLVGPLDGTAKIAGSMLNTMIIRIGKTIQ